MHPKSTARVMIKPNTYIYLVLLLFFVPFKWLIAWLIAVCVHEFCHFAAVRALGGEVLEFSVGIGGANIRCGPMSDRKRLMSVLGGPFGGFAVVLLGRWFPRLALCSWLLSAFNLLPLLNLDGGRALEILIGKRWAENVEKAVLGLLSIVAIYLSIILKFGILPLVIIGTLWLKSRNSPCKLRRCKVQ